MAEDVQVKPNIEAQLSYKIYRIIHQITIILFFFCAFFATGKASPMYERWNSEVQKFFYEGFVASSVLFLIVFAVTVCLFIRNRLYKNRTWDIFLYGSFIIVQYLLRLTMVGTLQMDEGLTSYTCLRNLTIDPSLIISNFVEAGKMSGRNAHGYMLFMLMGEFMEPLSGKGFQWMHIYFAIGVAGCMFGIFAKLFPKVNKFVLWIAAMAASFQPMFLGFSTMCSIEYGLLAFFIFAYYCYVYKRYILMLFWLLMLATCKSIGLIMALCFIFSVVAAKLLARIFKIKENEAHSEDEDEAENDEESAIDFKNIIIMAGVAIAGVILFIVIRNICKANGIYIDINHIKLKLAQLYVLNFAWLWAMVVLIGIVMVVANKRVKRTNRIPFEPLFVIVCCYAVHTAYLIFYPKSVLPRYDMLSDMVLVVLGIFVLLKLFERKRAVIAVLGVLGALMLGQSYVTIDPVSADVFTNVNTNSFPLLYTASFKKDVPVYYENAGDYSYYNYQYTFFDRAIDEILSQTSWTGDVRIITVYPGTETQFADSDVVWDKKTLKRSYKSDNDYERYVKINKNSFDSYVMAEVHDKNLDLIISPAHYGDDDLALALLAEDYDIAGPFLCNVGNGNAGKVVYYHLTHK